MPLSRLSFSVYLTHILIVWYFVLETRELIRFTYADFVRIFTNITKIIQFTHKLELKLIKHTACRSLFILQAYIHIQKLNNLFLNLNLDNVD